MRRKLPDFRAEKKAQNPVTSLAVMVFSVPMLEKCADFVHVADLRVSTKICVGHVLGASKHVRDCANFVRRVLLHNSRRMSEGALRECVCRNLAHFPDRETKENKICK